MSKTLEDVKWKEFEIGKEFQVKNSKFYNQPMLKPSIIGVPYITRSNSNNGFDSTVLNHNFALNPANTIVFGAENACFFYQPFKYITGNKMYFLLSDKINKFTGFFISQCLNSSIKNCGFGYGRGLTGTRLHKRKVLLPAKNNKPDYNFMEKYIKEKEKRLNGRYKSYIQKNIKDFERFAKQEKEWGEFSIGSLFVLSAGKSKGLNHLNISNSKVGINYLGATNRNNGVLCTVDKNTPNKFIQKGNCIAFIRNGEGSMGCSIYKAEDFIATSDITVGYNEHLNKYVGTFITTVADKVRGKYTFNYKRSDTRLKKEILQLPVNSNGEPDYKYMEKYMRYLEQKKILSYLNAK